MLVTALLNTQSTRHPLVTSDSEHCIHTPIPPHCIPVSPPVCASRRLDREGGTPFDSIPFPTPSHAIASHPISYIPYPISYPIPYPFPSPSHPNPILPSPIISDPIPSDPIPHPPSPIPHTPPSSHRYLTLPAPHAGRIIIEQRQAQACA